MTVYLIHFSPPYKHARHYIGWTTSASTVARRLEHHRKGSGGVLPRAAHLAGCEFVLAHVWPDADRTFERSLKNRKDTPAWCPLCKGGRLPVYQPPDPLCAK